MKTIVFLQAILLIGKGSVFASTEVTSYQPYQNSPNNDEYEHDGNIHNSIRNLFDSIVSSVQNAGERILSMRHRRTQAGFSVDEEVTCAPSKDMSVTFSFLFPTAAPGSSENDETNSDAPSMAPVVALRPTLIPTPGVCDVMVDVSCVLEGNSGTSCKTFDSPSMSCYNEDMAELKFTYRHDQTCSSTLGNSNQGDQYTCTDNNSPSCNSITAEDKVFVKCYNGNDVYCESRARDGGFVTISSKFVDNQEVLPNQITCAISTEADPKNPCQLFTFNPSGEGTSLNLKNQFGSLTLESCTNDQGQTNNCIESVIYKYNINNPGDTTVTITELSGNGQSLIEDKNSSELIIPMKSNGSLDQVGTIDYCTDSCYEISSSITATSSEGAICKDDGKLDFCVVVPTTTAPTSIPTVLDITSQPSQGPTPAPITTEPTLAPTCVPTGGFCTGTDASDKCCEDGAECVQDLTTGSGGQTVYKCTMLTPSPTKQPTSAPTTPEPTEEPTLAPTCVPTGGFCTGTDASDKCCEDGAECVQDLTTGSGGQTVYKCTMLTPSPTKQPTSAPTTPEPTEEPTLAPTCVPTGGFCTGTDASDKCCEDGAECVQDLTTGSGGQTVYKCTMLTPSPTKQPTSAPTTPEPTEEPTLAPTCVPTGGFCTGTDASDKCCEDGAECVQDLTTGSGGQTVYKCTMLTPSPTKQPTSAPTTPEPTEEPTLAPITLLPIPAPITPEPTKSPTATPSIFDVASLPTVSTTNAPITIEPTAPPTQKPTRVCRVDVDVDCRINLNDGSITVPCEDYQLPSFSCYERDMTNLVFLYSHSTCADAQGKNSQGDEYACADSNFQDTVCSFSSSDEVYVECRSGDHEFFSRPIKDGDYVAITIHSVVLNTLPDQITCTVSTSEGGTECQEFTFNPSGGDTPLNLKNKFGSLTLESCIDTEFNENECHKQVVYTYNVDNNGDTNVNIVELTDNGNDLTNGRNESDLAVPESESLAFQETGAMDYCTGSCVRKIANIIAMSSDGATCEDEEEIIFCVDPSPTPSPTRYPTPNPTRSPTSHPTNAPFVADPNTLEPTASPTSVPVTPTPLLPERTRAPTLVPSPSPTHNPTVAPTTLEPTPSPTRYPTANPTLSPTPNPTSHPTNAPFVADPITSEPTASPTGAPVTPNPVTLEPTLVPTSSPTRNPTVAPTTSEPTRLPTRYPTANPTLSPTPNPTSSPTNAPIVVDDEIAPTKSPTGAPVTPNPVTLEPTREATLVPTPSPTRNPTSEPTPSPTRYPTANPTLSPTSNPTSSPTNAPFVADPITSQPTSSPTGAPVTPEPTLALTLVPTPSPTRNPTSAPITPDPTVTPTVSPTDIPASRDDLFPIAPNPTRAPTVPITAEPTYARVTAEPTRAPITPNPTAYPTESPINLVELDGTAHPTCYPPQTDIQPSVVPEGSQNDSSDYNTSESKGDYIYGKKSSGKGRGKKSGKKGLNGKKSGKGSASTDSSNTDFSSGKSEAGGKGGKGGKRADFASGKGKGGGKGGKGGKGKDIGKGSISTVSKESYDGSGDSSHSKGSNTASGNTSASDSQSKYFESKGSSGKKSSRGGKKSGKYTGGKASTAAKGGYTESQDSSHSKGYDTTSGKSAEKASTSDASKGSYSDAGSTNSDNIPGSSHSKGSYGKTSKGKKNVKASTAAKGGYAESQDSSHSKGYDTASGKSAGKASTSDMSKGSFSDAGSPDMPGPKNNAPMDTNGGSGSADSPELPNYGNDYYSKGSDSNSGKAGYGKKWTGGSEDVLSSIDTGDTSKQGHFHYSSGKSSGKAPLDADIAGSVSGKSAGKASTSDVSKGSYSDTGSTGSSHSKGSYGKTSKGKKSAKATTTAKGGYTESQDSSHSKGYDTTSGKSAGKASTSDTSKGSYSDAGSANSDNIPRSSHSKGSYGKSSKGKKNVKASTAGKGGYAESQDSSHSKGYDTASGKSAGKASTSDTSKGSYSDAGSIYSDNISVSPASKGSYGQTSSGKKSAKASTEKKSGKTGKELRG